MKRIITCPDFVRLGESPMVFGRYSVNDANMYI